MPQPNMQQMLKQVQKMQQDMMAAQEQLKNEVVEASAGGGMVTVKVTGDLEIKDVRIAPEAVDPDDVELLQDWCWPRRTRRCARRRSSRRRRWAASPAASIWARWVCPVSAAPAVPGGMGGLPR